MLSVMTSVHVFQKMTSAAAPPAAPPIARKGPLMIPEESKSFCLHCQGVDAEWVSLQHCLYFCDECATNLQNPHYILELIHISELKENDIQKLLIGGNQRFQQFLRCLSYLNGRKVPLPPSSTLSNVYTSPPVLYYCDVLHDEYHNLPPRPYDEVYYENLSSKYSHSSPSMTTRATSSSSSSSMTTSFHLTDLSPKESIKNQITENSTHVNGQLLKQKFLSKRQKLPKKCWKKYLTKRDV